MLPRVGAASVQEELEAPLDVESLVKRLHARADLLFLGFGRDLGLVGER